MAVNLNRAIFTVTRRDGGWAVEHGGSFFDHSIDRNEVLASASRRARASNAGGWPSQICIEGEPNFRR